MTNLLDHFCPLLLVALCMTSIVITSNGVPLRNFHSVYIPNDNNNYYNVDFDKSIPLVANKPVLFVSKNFIEDGASNNNIINSLRSKIILKKKNSEIISVLMGLRKAMSTSYGDRHLHDYVR